MKKVSESAPAEIRREVQQIINRITSRRLEVVAELENKVTAKHVRSKYKIAAFWLLGQVGGKKARNLLKKIALDKNVKLEDRSIAVWSLSKISGNSVTTVLARVFKTESDGNLIWEAAKGLAINRKGAPYSLLVSCLRNDTSPIRREAAAYSLGWLGNKRYAKNLLSVVANQKELPGIRGQAAESLGILQYKKGVPQLIKALNDPSVEVRFWTAYALGVIGDAQAIPHLRRLARTDKHTLSGWWSIAKEARDATENIRKFCS